MTDSVGKETKVIKVEQCSCRASISHGETENNFLLREEGFYCWLETHDQVRGIESSTSFLPRQEWLSCCCSSARPTPMHRVHTSWVELPSLGLCLPPTQSDAGAQISTCPQRLPPSSWPGRFVLISVRQRQWASVVWLEDVDLCA